MMTHSDRARLARELHDGIAQDLVGVGYSLDILLGDPETSLDARSQLRTLRFTITDLIEKVRREIYFLRQPSDLSLAQLIEEAVQELCPESESQLTLEERPASSNSQFTYEFDRLVREILRNITLHAKAHHVFIDLKHKEDSIELSIADDGIGGAQVTDGHYGIHSIQDRTTTLNGTVEFESDASGTKVTVRLPNPSETNE